MRRLLVQIERRLRGIDCKQDEILKSLEHTRGLIRRDFKKEEASMSALSDKIAAVKTAIADATDRVVTDIDALKAKIAELQAIVDAGGASQADLDALDEAKAALDELDPTTVSTIKKHSGHGKKK
jgi:predicted  nucleic acid-binding Zn-ribbon protein